MIVVRPAELRGLDAAALEALLARRECVVVIGEGELRGLAAAACLFADYCALIEGATLCIDCGEAWAGVVWRLRRRALSVAGFVAAEQAREQGLVDEVIVAAEPWLETWLRHRSTAALDTAAALLGANGGDALERAAFARLFAAGEPQKGLAAFLAKRPPAFGE